MERFVCIEFPNEETRASTFREFVLKVKRCNYKSNYTGGHAHTCRISDGVRIQHTLSRFMDFEANFSSYSAPNNAPALRPIDPSDIDETCRRKSRFPLCPFSFSLSLSLLSLSMSLYYSSFISYVPHLRQKRKRTELFRHVNISL